VTSTRPADPSGCTFDRPLKIIALAEKPPESSLAIADHANGFQLAVEQINARGGVCGQRIDFERLPLTTTDPAFAKTAYQAALAKQPDVTVGVPDPTMVLALTGDVAAAMTPMLWFAAVAQNFVGARDSVASEWGFTIRPRTATLNALQAEYLVKELGRKRVGLMCANRSSGDAECTITKVVVEALGGQVVAREIAETNASFMLSQINVLKNSGSDSVFAFNVPVTLAAFLNQAAESGLNVPMFAGTTAALAVQTKTVKPDALKNLWGIDDCVPVGDTDNKVAQEFVSAYRAKFSADPTYIAAEAYDSIFLAAEAAKKAGRLDKRAIANALRTIEYQGACEKYKADPGQGLHHSIWLETFESNGKPVAKKRLEVPAPIGGG
jgi:branched-chain amino acid transport system substrate-binding protein